jgi:hypothetical protein
MIIIIIKIFVVINGGNMRIRQINVKMTKFRSFIHLVRRVKTYKLRPMSGPQELEVCRSP